MNRSSITRLCAGWTVVAMAIAACTPAASPLPQASSPAASPPAASASVAASPEASASPSVSAEASASPSATAAASAEASGVTGADITVQGVDYAFAGIPDDVPAGTSLGFRNAGNEVHEMIVFRLNDDVTQSLPELLALPQEEAMKLVTQVGVAFAGPGEDAEDVVTVEEPGTYGMACFIPLGTRELPQESPGASAAASPPAGGPPHFVIGMLKAFTVSE